jgi:hypothetical protein
MQYELRVDGDQSIIACLRSFDHESDDFWKISYQLPCASAAASDHAVAVCSFFFFFGFLLLPGNEYPIRSFSS